MQAAPPTTVGAWSMAVVLWQQYEYMYMYPSVRMRSEGYSSCLVCVCVCVCVCVSVCLSAHAILAVRAIKSITKDTIVLSVRFAAILKWRFS